MSSPDTSSGPQPVMAAGRYILFGEIARGGMATVHFGRMLGVGGFSRTVAIKRLRRDVALDPQSVAMFIDEARLAARIEHPNVVATLDVVAESGEVFLVMEYVRGETLAGLMRVVRAQADKVPLPIATSVVCGALAGLHAAHEAVGADGAPLGIIHRDVSPQNILVGEDGIARITDFGIARAEAGIEGEDGMTGKLGYMAPEQLGRTGKTADRRIDIFTMATVLWESLAGRRLFQGDHPGEMIAAMLSGPMPPVSSVRPDIPPALDRVIMRALSRNPAQRPSTAEEFASAIENALERGIASPRLVGNWVNSLAGQVLESRTKYVREIEAAATASFQAPEWLARLAGLSSDGRTAATSVDTATECERAAVTQRKEDLVPPSSEPPTPHYDVALANRKARESLHEIDASRTRRKQPSSSEPPTLQDGAGLGAWREHAGQLAPALAPQQVRASSHDLDSTGAPQGQQRAGAAHRSRPMAPVQQPVRASGHDLSYARGPLRSSSSIEPAPTMQDPGDNVSSGFNKALAEQPPRSSSHDIVPAPAKPQVRISSHDFGFAPAVPLSDRPTSSHNIAGVGSHDAGGVATAPQSDEPPSHRPIVPSLSDFSTRSDTPTGGHPVELSAIFSRPHKKRLQIGWAAMGAGAVLVFVVIGVMLMVRGGGDLVSALAERPATRAVLVLQALQDSDSESRARLASSTKSASTGASSWQMADMKDDELDAGASKSTGPDSPDAAKGNSALGPLPRKLPFDATIPVLP